MSNLFAVLGLLIMVVSFLITNQALKDYRVVSFSRFTNPLLLKVIFVAVLASQLAIILDIGYNKQGWLVFDMAILALLTVIYFSYKEKYLSLAIELVDHTEYLKISSERYEEVAPGVECRTYMGGPPVASFEESMIEYAKPYFEAGYVVVFARAIKGSIFKDHKHPVSEILYVCKGLVAIDPRSPDKVGPGQSRITPAGEPHNLRAFADSNLVAILGQGGYLPGHFDN
jgi:quercetin dioxygenase-like cupin family protein